MGRIAVYGHCTIDTITAGGATEEAAGGPACYCGTTAARFGFDAELHTRYGPDLPPGALDGAGGRGAAFSGAPVESPTTRFSIEVADGGASRALSLGCTCDEIPFEPSDADGTIVSPVAGEVSARTLDMVGGACARAGRPVLVDVQGFVRRAAPGGGPVSLGPAAVGLRGMSAVKAGRGELECVSGGASCEEGMLAVQKAGAERVVHTDGDAVRMLSGDRMYSLSMRVRSVRDTTGAGDILAAAFLCTLIREDDDLWALCFGAGAAQAALESARTGLGKVPERRRAESNASYFYNTVKFKGV